MPNKVKKLPGSATPKAKPIILKKPAKQPDKKAAPPKPQLKNVEAAKPISQPLSTPKKTAKTKAVKSINAIKADTIKPSITLDEIIKKNSHKVETESTQPTVNKKRSHEVAAPSITIQESSPVPTAKPLLTMPSFSGTYMDKEQQQYFRQCLLDLKSELLAESQRTQELLRNEETQSGGTDDGDRSVREEQMTLSIRARNREFHLVRKIENALQRLDEKEYGYCESCGNEIGLGRLHARLTAAQCIDCKQVLELKEKHRRS